MVRRSGFTLIEILIVVAIICVVLAVAAFGVTSGRDAARVRAAARGVSQMSHYANALAILRQHPAVITFSGNTITVQLSGEGVDTSEVGQPSLPIYQEVNGVNTTSPADEEVVGSGDGDDASGEEKKDGKGKKSAGYIHVEDPLDFDELAKEDATRSFEGVVFRVEPVDEDGHPLDTLTSNQLKSEADALIKKREVAGAAWSNTSGEIDLKDDSEEKHKGDPENEGRVIYETNGNCTPYIVRLFSAAGESGEEEGEELMVVHVSRSGKVTIGDDEEGNGKR